MTKEDDLLSLHARARLPDALRVLVESYPREGWESHPNFTALTRFWLERHLMFRQLQDMLVEETQGVLDRSAAPERFGARLGRLGNMFLGELHAHHGIEDMHYFPRLRALDARLERGFDLLDADHHALDAGLTGLAEAANGALRAVRTGAPVDGPAGALHRDLLRFRGFLDRHLTDEEEIVVPVILANAGGGLE